MCCRDMVKDPVVAGVRVICEAWPKVNVQLSLSLLQLQRESVVTNIRLAKLNVILIVSVRLTRRAMQTATERALAAVMKRPRQRLESGRQRSEQVFVHLDLPRTGMVGPRDSQ